MPVRSTRITPAGAGKTTLQPRFAAASRDHPRRCGENGISVPSVKTITGSPPQVRGKPVDAPWIDDEKRITPAGAGKTMVQAAAAYSAGDHPRRCGENLMSTPTATTGRGSPPQVRGKLIVPSPQKRTHTGSPPQVRGKPNRKRPNRAIHRITPAGAGKTLKRSFRNQPFCSRAVQISFNFSNSLNVSLQSGSAR